MKSILIRAEDKNEWERRSPIVPKDLKALTSELGLKSYVEKSDKRFFPESQYTDAGAEICKGMDKGDIILGIKEIPMEKLLDNKIYLYFSHTIKAQKDNMPMLKRLIESGSTLIDYEKIIDESGKRGIFFGNYAGHAGAINILHLMGEYWKHHGIDTPFGDIRQALNYESVAQAKEYISKIGQLIIKTGMNKRISPLVIGVLGYGNVASGVHEILNCLPVQAVEPENLRSLVEHGDHDSSKVHVCVFKEKHLVKRKDKSKFDLQDYFSHPEKYVSDFEQYLPFVSILINAVYWDERCPRFITWDGLEKLYKNYEKPKLCGIADITCDTGGSVECNVKSTDSGMPAYLCNPVSRSIKDGHCGDGIVILAIDNLPAEVPNDSSTFFSRQLSRFISNLVNSDFEKPLEESGLSSELQRGVIVYKGSLTKSYEHLAKYLP